MRKLGLLLLAGSLAATLLTLSLWVLGLALGIGGGLIHLLLVLAITAGPVGFAAGLVLLLLSSRPPANPSAEERGE